MKGRELAINTDFADENAQLERVRDVLRKIANAGFTHIHWCYEWEGEYIYSSYEMQQIREWMDEYGLKSKALHATKGSVRNVNIREKHYRRDYTSNWEYNRKAGVELIKNRVDLAEVLGASEIVLHLYVPHITIAQKPESKEDFYACTCRSLTELMPYCLEKRIRICLENLFDMPGEYMLEAWDRLFAKFPPEFLGLCYDTGHANMIWGGQSPDILKAYQDRIFAVHLHDNDGDSDSHRIPGRGTVNWEAVMEMLAGSAYDAPLLLEVSKDNADEELFLAEAFQAGCRLEELYQNAKQAIRIG